MFDVVEKIVRNTRSISLPHFGDVAFKQKDDKSYLTELDIAVEKYLEAELQQITPDVSFVGEETGGDTTAKKFWLCDPIDGTNPYVRGLPFCTTMLALIEDDVVTMSFIYDFVTDEMYSARRGHGAYSNGEKISVSTRSPEDAYVFTDTLSVELIALLYKKYSILDFMASGSVYAAVATGKVEGRIYFDGGGKGYDIAPGSLLVEEAGGIVRGISHDVFHYDQMNHIAAAPSVFASLEEDVKHFHLNRGL